MAMNYVSIFFVTVFLGIECRSIVSSNLNQAGSEKHEASKANFLQDISVIGDVNDVKNVTNVNRKFGNRIFKHFPKELKQLFTIESLTIENLLSEFIANAVNETDQKDTVARLLKLLKFTLDDLASGIPIEKLSINEANDGKKESTLHEEKNNFVFIRGNNWLEDLQEILDNQYIDTETSEDNEGDDESTSMDLSTLHSLIDSSSEETEDGLLEQFDSEESDDVETNLHVNNIGSQKTLEKLCRKHRTAK